MSDTGKTRRGQPPSSRSPRESGLWRAKEVSKKETMEGAQTARRELCRSRSPERRMGVVAFLIFLGLILTTSPSSAEPVTNVTFVAFDLETTSLDAQSGRVIEIGAVKFRNGKVLKSRGWLINPGVLITADSQRIHGVTEEMVADSPSFREVFPQFAGFIKGAVLLAHNADFDVRFISAELERNNMSIPENIVLDILRLARVWFPDAGSYNLENLVKYLGTPAGSFHRALADSEHITAFFMAGVKKLAPNATLEDFIKTADPILKFGYPEPKR